MAVLPTMKTKVGEFSLGEAFAVGLAKSISENLLSMVIGNGTYMSGIVKLGMAWAIPKYVLKNQFGKVIGTAMAVDGTEDVINNALGGLNARQTSQSPLI